MRLAEIVWVAIGFIFSLILSAVFLAYAHKWWLKGRFRLRYGSKGKNILFVYSNSPNWKEYLEANIIPRIERQAVILNWSERRNWIDTHPFEAKIFQRWAGAKEFNPVAIVFPANGKVKVIRFWRAFRDYKHGKDQALRRAEAELLKEISAPSANIT